MSNITSAEELSGREVWPDYIHITIPLMSFTIAFPLVFILVLCEHCSALGEENHIEQSSGFINRNNRDDLTGLYTATVPVYRVVHAPQQPKTSA